MDDKIARPMNQALRRSMSLVHATAMVVGIILGASIFIQPSEITRLVPSARGVLLVWLAAGALTFCGAMICAELSSVFPETGGVYVFLRGIFSPLVGFLWGWGMFWSMHSAIIAAIAVILGRYTEYFISLGDWGVRLVAITVVLLLSLINYLGVKPGSAVQVILTALKLAAIVILAIVLFGFGGTAHRQITTSSVPLGSVPMTAYALAIGAGLFAYGGWHMVTYAAGETIDPGRTLPRALMFGCAIVTACYMLLNAGYLYVMPVPEVGHSSRIASHAVQRVLGVRAGGAIAVVVVISALGALNGIILAGPRVYYAMAQDGLAFRWMGAINRKHRTPHWAIAAQAVWACVLVATNSYRELFTRVVYTEWLFFALLAAGLFVLRRRAAWQPSYLGSAFPIALLLFIIAALAIALNQIRVNPWSSASGVVLILLGVPVYFFVAKARKNANR
jgi:basic amino acid/polyamine antiporter, APA family